MKKTMLGMICLWAAACTGAAESTATTTAPIAEGLEGTYDFVLEASDVAPKLRERCAGDAACWKEIESDAQKEKIRFTRTAKGLVFTSFAVEGAREIVFFEAPAELGRVERRADGTIAIVDAKKGRLVYRRAS